MASKKIPIKLAYEVDKPTVRLLLAKAIADFQAASEAEAEAEAETLVTVLSMFLFECDHSKSIKEHWADINSLAQAQGKPHCAV